MKKLIIIVTLILLATTCEAKIYVCLDKQTGEPKGTTDLDPKNISQWASQYTMIIADESYRGLKGYEIKYENQTLRKATPQEIAQYEEEQEALLEADSKEKALKTLGLTDEDIEKVKKLPKNP